MKSLLALGTLAAVAMPFTAHCRDITIEPRSATELKAVYGQVQARNSVLARARIGGTIVSLKATEGDQVEAGDIIGRIVDEKIDFQVKSVDAQLLGLQASLKNAQAELDRGEKLIKTGATTEQRLEQLRTQVDVFANQIKAAEAQRSVLTEQQSEGAVLAPTAGKILTVPVTKDTVVMPGETIATIAGGGFFLRLAIPERHAMALRRGAEISIEAGDKAIKGRLAKIYPEITGGRVTADVEVTGLDTEFVGARVLVELPVGTRQAIFVPSAAVSTRSGIDFVSVRENGKPVDRAVVSGGRSMLDGMEQTEILTGLEKGDIVVTP